MRQQAELGEVDSQVSAPARQEVSRAEEEMPRVVLTRRQIVLFAVFILSGIAFFYFVLPKLAGVGTTLHRIERGDSWWIAAGVVLEIASFAGYVVLFRAVFVRGGERIDWSESYQITMAGLVATRLFAAAGAGGVALTAWALRRSGMEPRLVACRMVAFMVLLYVIYAASLLIDGIGLGSGLFPGGGSFAITILPAIIAAVLFAIAGAMALLPGRSRAAPGALGLRFRAPDALDRARRDRAGARGQRGAHGDRSDPLAEWGSTRGAGVVGL